MRDCAESLRQSFQHNELNRQVSLALLQARGTAWRWATGPTSSPAIPRLTWKLTTGTW